MDLEALKKLPREVQVVLGGTVLYVIFSFFDWQQASGNNGLGAHLTVGGNEWNGIGFIAALLALVLLVWEIGRLIDFKISLPGSLTPGLVSAGLAALLLLFTVITFLVEPVSVIGYTVPRHWPSWVGLILSIVIAAAAFVRAKAEGVQMPNMPKNMSMGGSGSTAPSSTPPAPAPPAAPEATTPPPPPPADAEA